jgi:hypothetical protein
VTSREESVLKKGSKSFESDLKVRTTIKEEPMKLAQYLRCEKGTNPLASVGAM